MSACGSLFTNAGSPPPRPVSQNAHRLSGLLDSPDLLDAARLARSYGGKFEWRVELDSPESVRRDVLMDLSGIPSLDDEWLSEEITMSKWSAARLPPEGSCAGARPTPASGGTANV